MIFRAQSLRALNAQRVSKLPQAKQKNKLPCSHRPVSRCGSLAEVNRLPGAAETSSDAATASPLSPAITANVQAEASVERGGNSTAALLGMCLGLVLTAGPAYAAYDKSSADQLFKNFAGGAYALLVCFFFYRLFTRRAASGTSQSLRSKVQESLQDEMKAKETTMDDKPVTPLTALWGAAQAGVICFLLFQVCLLVDGYFAGQELPDQYTARNITVTLRTIVRGLAYLMTFLFGANCMGLSGLAVQLLFFPEEPESGAQQEDKASQ